MKELPINLNHEAQAEWEKYLQASGIEEQILHLELFLGVVVKHKGVENHLRMVKQKLKRLKAQQEKLRQSKKGSGEKWLVPKGEDAQVGIIGTVNSGKSSFLNILARADAARVGTYPFTTIKPVVGSITTKGARLQLVELPALVEGSSRGDMSGKLVLAGIRNVDCLLICIDLSRDPIQQLELILTELNQGKIRVNIARPAVTVEKVGSGNIQVFNGHFFGGEGKEAVLEITRANGYSNAIVRFHAPTSVDQFIDALNQSITFLPGLIIATKGDLEGSKQNFTRLSIYIRENGLEFEVVPTSTYPQEGFVGLEEKIFDSLGKTRIYTRDASGKIAERPIILNKRQATVQSAIEVLSKNMLKYFRFARVWGASASFDGEKVGLDRSLSDGDVIQVFA